MSETTVVVVIAASVILGTGAWAGWTVGGWHRRRRAQPPPGAVWLCDACHSFNDLEQIDCYRCHRPRRADAPTIVPHPEFHADQHLGRTGTSVSWGASRPWLGADEPLRDAWLASRTGPAAGAEAGSEAAATEANAPSGTEREVGP